MNETPRTPGDDATEAVRRYFDDRVDDWDRYYRGIGDHIHQAVRDRLEIALAMLEDLPRGARVLDAGCGAGPLTIELARRGLEVDAVDIAPRMVERCRELLVEQGLAGAHTRCLTGNIDELDLPRNSYAAIAALGYLQYQEDEASALRRFAELLAPGGSLVVSGPVRPLYQRARRRLAQLLGRRRGQPADELQAISRHEYSRRRFRRLLEGAGLRVVRTCPHAFFNFDPLSSALGPGGRLTLHRWMRSLGRRVRLDPFARDMVVLARR